MEKLVLVSDRVCSLGCSLCDVITGGEQLGLFIFLGGETERAVSFGWESGDPSCELCYPTVYASAECNTQMKNIIHFVYWGNTPRWQLLSCGVAMYTHKLYHSHSPVSLGVSCNLFSASCLRRRTHQDKPACRLPLLVLCLILTIWDNVLHFPLIPEKLQWTNVNKVQ